MKITIKAVQAVLIIILSCLPALAAEQVFFYHTDPAGTPLSMTNSSGTVVWKADYKPFGEENSTTGPTANDRRFVGKEKDEETGLSYFGARYEEAKTGRFIAPDPVRTDLLPKRHGDLAVLERGECNYFSTLTRFL